METMYIVDGLRVHLMSVEEFVEHFQQILMEEMYVVLLCLANNIVR